MLLYPAGRGARGPHDDPRHSIATARLNWLHARWPIRNDDMLYTLRCAPEFALGSASSMFILEPPRWFARYGYRPLTELEREALWLVWKEVRSRHSIPLISQNGKLMQIEGIPDTLAELERWSDDFAREAFRPAETNKQVADASIGLFLSPAPAWLHPLGRTLTACLMEPLLREAV